MIIEFKHPPDFVLYPPRSVKSAAKRGGFVFVNHEKSYYFYRLKVGTCPIVAYPMDQAYS